MIYFRPPFRDDVAHHSGMISPGVAGASAGRLRSGSFGCSKGETRMPAERTIMRQVREVLRLKFVGGVSIREIARRIGVAASTVLDRKAPPRVRKTLARNDQWRMGAKERITRELIMAHLRSLERPRFVVPSVDPDGQVRWRITEKGRRED